MFFSNRLVTYDFSRLRLETFLFFSNRLVTYDFSRLRLETFLLNDPPS